MRHSLASMIFGATVLIAGAAAAQSYPSPLFPIAPAPPEMFPTWSPYSDDLAGTAHHNIAATPGCGAANPQGGIPSMVTGTCP
jgi:hypothetical protein